MRTKRIQLQVLSFEVFVVDVHKIHSFPPYLVPTYYSWFSDGDWWDVIWLAYVLWLEVNPRFCACYAELRHYFEALHWMSQWWRHCKGVLDIRAVPMFMNACSIDTRQQLTDDFLIFCLLNGWMMIASIQQIPDERTWKLTLSSSRDHSGKISELLQY